MKVLSPGTDVTIEQANIPGKISAVIIRANHVAYEIKYYVDFAMRTVECSEDEIQTKPREKRLTVGFK